jgi:hypothetical protein
VVRVAPVRAHAGGGGVLGLPRGLKLLAELQ